MTRGREEGQATIETLVLAALASVVIAAALSGLSSAVAAWIEKIVKVICSPIP